MNNNRVNHQSPIALLLIDVINDLEFEGAARLIKQAMPMAGAHDEPANAAAGE